MANQPSEIKKNPVKIFFEEVSKNSITIIFLAIFTGLVLGGILAAATSVEIYEAFGSSFGEGIRATLDLIWKTYSSLFIGAFGTPSKMIEALRGGERTALLAAFKPFFESLVVTTPYLFTGLAIAMGFRAGVFNIGAEGQLYMGSIMAGWAGWTFKGLPPIVHIPLAMGVGILAGGLWGFIPGWLKAKTGAHEVINTIMMNYIAFNFAEYLIAGPFQDPKEAFKTPFIRGKRTLIPLF